MKKARHIGGADPYEAPSPSFFIGDRVRSHTNREGGYVTGFRNSDRLGFRYVVIWDDRKGYSLVPPTDLTLEYSSARDARGRRRSAG